MKNLSLLALALLFLVACENGEKHSISLKLKEGSKYFQNMNSDMTMDISAMGITKTVTMEIISRLSFDVQKENSNSYDVRVRYEDIDLNIKEDQNSMGFSSMLGDTSTAIDTLMNSLTSKPFDIVLDKAGKVTEIKNLDEVIQEVFNEAMSSMQAEQIMNVREEIENVYGEQTFRSIVEQSFAYIPKSDVGLGEKWHVQSPVQVQVPLQITGDYKLEEVTDSTYTIINNSTFEPKGETGSQSMEIEGNMEGKMIVDRQTGWIINSNLSQFFEVGNQSGMGDMLKVSTRIVVTD